MYFDTNTVIHTKYFAHLYVEVFKCHSVTPEQLHRVSGNKANSEETLHLVRAGPLGHLEVGRWRWGGGVIWEQQMVKDTREGKKKAKLRKKNNDSVSYKNI